MDFLRKHYEKVLLGVVLLGLALAVAVLPFKIASERQKLEDLRQGYINRPVQSLTNLDLSVPDRSLKRLALPVRLDLSEPNKVFNPMTWLKTPDGRLIRSEKAGPASAFSTNFVPLYLRITFDSVSVSSDATIKYVIGVEKQAAPVAANRPKKSTYTKVGEKTDTFVLSAVGGPPDNPTNIVLTLNDTSETALVSKEQPFRRVDGYMADVRYEVEKKSWPARRVGNVLPMNNEDYKIVTISSNEVVVTAPNQKKWTIKSSPGP